MSMGFIIKAVLGLVVLVVIVSIFASKANIFGKSVSKTCTERGGQCQADDFDCDSVGKPIKQATKDCGGTDKTKDKRCCLPVGK